MAGLIGVSRSRLRCLFKLQIGRTPLQYLKERRLESAEVLLRTQSLSVKQVMVQVGLTNYSHFQHDFKKRYGLSPARYRTSQIGCSDARSPASIVTLDTE